MKHKRNDVQTARRIHVQAKKTVLEEMERKVSKIVRQGEEIATKNFKPNKPELKMQDQELTPIQKIYQEARQKKLIQETLKADEEPTMLYPTIEPDPTEEFNTTTTTTTTTAPPIITSKERIEPITNPPETLHEELLELASFSYANKMTDKEQIAFKKKIQAIARKVKELQDELDITNNNIRALYHSTNKKK